MQNTENSHDLESTLVILKNDCVTNGHIGDVISRFETVDLLIAGMRMVTPSRGEVEEHYAVHKEKPFFDAVVTRMAGKRIVLMVVMGPHAISRVRHMTGKTDCSEQGTIRHAFGTGIEANVLHSSDSAESAAYEINLWNDTYGLTDV